MGEEGEKKGEDDLLVRHVDDANHCMHNEKKKKKVLRVHCASPMRPSSLFFLFFTNMYVHTSIQKE